MKRYFIRVTIYAAIGIAFIAALFIILRYKSNMTSHSVSTTTISSKTASLLKEADSLEKQGNLIAAREIYQSLLYDCTDTKRFTQLQDKISFLNIKILFSPTPTLHNQLYVVEPGDSLAKIAKKFNTTIELIKKANNLNGNLIKPGMQLKVENSSFSILVDKSQNTLTLVRAGEVVKIYTVSTGKDNSTPTGTFRIVEKLINPTWYSVKGVIPPGSPENVLGARWLGIDRPRYGIHGTDDPSTIGYQCTEGCVRMHNADVEELYTIVPRGTEVTIID